MPSHAKLTTKPLPNPGFAARHPLFPSMVRLFDELGETNQFILVNELAIREFRDQVQESGSGVQGSVEAISKKHKIRVSTNRLDKVLMNRTGWYTRLVYEAFDRSLRELIREIHLYKSVQGWVDARGREQMGALEQLAANQPAGQRRLDDYPEFHLLEYYRAVRNELIHPPRSRQNKAAAIRKRFIDSWPQHAQTVYGCRSAPNLVSDLDFDDFFLQTRVARDYSAILSDAYELTVGEVAALAETDEALRRSVQNSNGTRRRVGNIYREYFVDSHLRRGDAQSFAHADQFVEAMLLRHSRAFAD